ncbi:hypothetical protein EVAR_33643_1 [Eumeta japonica]|uniref:Uncharacterized protein n=1 Tax=Eumeta variegata TaxID=151549 RepID=A0A4C1VNG8_EUMVA|nr:hypothetical protein EVAR_33643_1 [Eumeta japonica]
MPLYLWPTTLRMCAAVGRVVSGTWRYRIAYPSENIVAFRLLSESYGDPLTLHHSVPLSLYSPLYQPPSPFIRYPISTQEAGNALDTPLGSQVHTGDGDYSLAAQMLVYPLEML